MSWTSLSEVLIFGLAALVVGGILAMIGTIREDARTALPPHHPILMTWRRSLPRHALCRLGIALMGVGFSCILASYLVRM